MKIALLEPLNVSEEMLREMAAPVLERGHELTVYDTKADSPQEVIRRAQGMDAVKEGNRLTYEHPGLIVLGEREPGTVSARVRAVAAYLTAHGVQVNPVEDMVRRQWGKLMLNVGINQACMVFECNYGGVQQPGRPREVMLGAMREAQKLAKLEGYPISEEEFDGWVALADSLAPGGKPSMRQDGEAHRKSEVELFAGTMVRLGRKHGVEVPANAWLYEKVKEMEAAY